MIKTNDIPSPMECAEHILSYLPHGMRSVNTLLAQCRLLRELPAMSTGNTEAFTQRIEDLTQTIAGMEAHLQTIHDVVDNAQMYATDIIEAGDGLEDDASLVRYFVCVDSKKDSPFESGGSCREHPTRQAALTELRQVRRKQPGTYLARVIYQRLAEPAEDAKPAKPKGIAA